MRRLLQYFLISFLFLLSCTLNYDEKSLYGTWVAKDGEVEVLIIFYKDSTCEIKYKSGNSDKTKISGDYEIDISKNPIPLTIRNIPQLKHPLHTIIQFNNINEIIIAEFAPRWRLRPIAFNPETQIIFKRKN